MQNVPAFIYFFFISTTCCEIIPLRLRPPRPVKSWYGDGKGNTVVTNPKWLIKKGSVFACKAADGFLPQFSPHWRIDGAAFIPTSNNRTAAGERGGLHVWVAQGEVRGHHWWLRFATTNGSLLLWQWMESFTLLGWNVPFPPCFKCFVL